MRTNLLIRPCSFSERGKASSLKKNLSFQWHFVDVCGSLLIASRANMCEGLKEIGCDIGTFSQSRVHTVQQAQKIRTEKPQKVDLILL